MYTYIYYSRILAYALGILVATAAIAPIAFAQEGTERRIAVTPDVSITESSLTASEGRDLTATFTVKGDGAILPDVRYGIALYSTTTDGALLLIDAAVADTTFDIKAGESVTRTFTYTPPQKLEGRYLAVLEVRNAADLILDRRVFGPRDFVFSGQVVPLAISECQFHNLQSVGAFRCGIANLGGEERNISAVVSLRENGVFGKEVGQSTRELTLASGVIEQIDFTGFATSIPGGVYTAVISLHDSETNAPLVRHIVSESVGAPTPAITSVFFEKGTDGATSMSVAINYGSRDLSFRITSDREGSACDGVTSPFSGIPTVIPLLLCPSERIVVELLSGDGTVLDSEEVRYPSDNPLAFIEDNESASMYLYTGVVLLALIGVLILLRRGPQKTLMMLALGLVFFAPGGAEASGSEAIKYWACTPAGTSQCPAVDMAVGAYGSIGLYTGETGQMGKFYPGELIVNSVDLSVIYPHDGPGLSLEGVQLAGECPGGGCPQGTQMLPNSGVISAGVAPWIGRDLLNGNTSVSNFYAPNTPGIYTYGYFPALIPDPNALNSGYVMSPFSYGSVTIEVIPRPVPTGDIWTTPANTCVIPRDSNRCTVNVGWTTTNTGQSSVLRDPGGLWANEGPSHNQDYIYVDSTGLWFDLYPQWNGGGTRLDRAFVRGVCAAGDSFDAGGYCRGVTYSCNGTIPANASEWDAEERDSVPQNTSWGYANPDTATKCQYRCDAGYVWNGSSCIGVTYSCNGTIPANASEWDAEERDSVPQNTSWGYANPDTATKCQYRCDAGHVWNGFSCVPATFTCTGSIPTGGERWDAEEESGLSANTSWVYSSTDTNAKCEYGAVDLTADMAPTVNGALTQGQNVTFNGRVRNSGDLSVTGGFSDNFTYCWGAGCNPATMIGGHIAKSVPFAAGATSNDISGSLPLSNIGVLRVQHCIDSLGQVSESDESIGDNCRTSEFIVSGTGAPNLTANVTPTVNGSLTQGQTVTFNGQVFNSGGVTVSNSFSDNFTYCWGHRCGDWTQIGAHIPQSVPFGVGATSNDTSASFPLTNTGVLRIQHCVDSQGTINESNEWDNCREVDFSIAPGTPPQTLTLTINPSSAQASPVTGLADMTLSWTGSNFPGGVNNCTVEQSSTVSMSPSGTIGVNVPSTGTMNGMQMVGTLYYRVTCPTQGVFSNVATFTVTPPPLPNLSADLAPDGTLTQGQSVTFNGQVRNSGSVPVTASFSNNFTYRWSSAEPWTQIGAHIPKTYSVGSPFGVGATSNDTSVPFALNNGGDLQVQYCADSLGQITESNETPADNCDVEIYRVTPTQNIAANMDPTVNGTLTQGQSVTFNGQVINNGGVTVQYPFSDSFSFCWGVGCKLNVHGSPIAKSVPFSVGATSNDTSAPFTLANSGQLTITHCVDSGGALGETNEADNCRTTVFSVTAAPNLTATNVNPSGDPTYSNPFSITFSGTIQNAGEQTNSREQIYADVEIDWNQSNCALATPEQSFPAGGPWQGVLDGWSEPVSATLLRDSAELQNGNHCYRVIVDRDNIVTESNNDDNAAPWWPFEITALEECADGIDNNGNGLIDGADPNCGGGGPNENGRCTGGPIPSDMVRHDAEEEAGLSSNVAWDYAPLDTARKCQYRCSDPDARLVGGNCITGTITADPDLIPAGGSSMLEWAVMGDISGLSCEVTDGIKPISDQPSGAKVDTGPLFTATIYTLGCGGVALDTATVSLFPPPTLTPDPRVVELGGSSELYYNLNGNTGCELTGGGLSIPLDDSVQTGSREVTNIRGTTTYTINCSGSTGSATVELREIGQET